jgi:myo-inositol 2-dehydrogenase / D-chiro-inositol 1-dehydrogenase
LKENRAVGLGVIGCGNIAYWVHLRIAKHLRGAALIAAADPDPTARERARGLAKVPVYASNDELLSRSDVDAVIISGPTHLHAELVIAACDAGKHVYLEKPLATSTADGARAGDAAKRAGVKVMLGFNRRFHPLFEQARGLLRAGAIGRIRAVQSTFCEPMVLDTMPGWKRDRETGGGVLFDLASHHIDLLRWFLGDEAASVGATVESELSDQDSARLELTTNRGVQTQHWFSCRTGMSDWFEFSGEKATLRVDRHTPRVALRVPRRFGHAVRTQWVTPSADMRPWLATRLIRPSKEPSYRRSLAAFVGMLQGRPVSVAGLVDGMRVLEVIEAAEDSARSRCVVDIGAGVLAAS